MPPAPAADRVRLVELLGAISLATDLGTGQPHAHGIRTSVLAVEIGRALGLGAAALGDVQQVTLLRFLGCTADSSETARMTGGDDIAFLAAMAPVVMGRRPEMARRLATSVGAGQPAWRRATMVAGAMSDPGGAKRSLSAHCEVAAMLAGRLGMSGGVTDALAHGHERWDGLGFPDGASGEEIPQAVRVAVVARDADLWWRAGGPAMVEVLRSRRGHGYDPVVVDACLDVGPGVLTALDEGDAWEATLAADRSAAVIEGDALDDALEAIGHFADLKSPWTRGHSTRVSDLAEAAAKAMGITAVETVVLRRAALVADLGRVGVPNGIWDRRGPLGVADRERMRSHTVLTEQTLACCAALEPLGRLAGAHHERADGSGYHRRARELDRAERILGAADVVAALGEDRPHRPALTGDDVVATVGDEVREGRLDPAAADAVLAAAGHRPAASRGTWPAGLSDREVEVLQLITRGHTNKEVAGLLHLSAKTVGRHIENVYTKIGVNSRAAAAVFAMQHRLLDSWDPSPRWGVHPMR